MSMNAFLEYVAGLPFRASGPVTAPRGRFLGLASLPWCAVCPSLSVCSALQVPSRLLLYPSPLMRRRFTHRFNDRAHNFDSICHLCFRTVVTATQEADLEQAEKRHSCEPEDKRRFDLFGEAATVYFEQERHA